jgi:hypothetical protein
MTESEKHIGLLFTAELQLRLASAVRLATSLGTQPIDLPDTWAHGNHLVRYGEIALRQDQGRITPPIFSNVRQLICWPLR